tara:strand:- start:1076 stop:1954 length:879 start_codon:yes stop_codon:yes gene_type:complete
MSFKIFSNFRSENHPTYDGIKEICKNKPITFFYDYIPKNIEELQINPFNFIMIHEPNEFFGMHKWVISNHHLFSGILTWNQELIDKCPNSTHFHSSTEGLCSQPNDFLNNFNKINSQKNFEVSFLCGVKNLVEGHKLRQDIYKIESQIEIPKKWFYVLDDFNNEKNEKGEQGRPNSIWEGKQVCFKESMFHISVENVNHPNWYTEKIADAFATYTVPIYWGCDNLEDNGYDSRGVIRFNSVPELINIINSLTPEIYEKMRPYMEHNYQVVKQDRLKDKLEIFFEQVIKLNEL